MQVALIPGRHIDDDLAGHWTDLQLSNPHLASPFFSPEFARTVAAVRDDVEVAIVSEGKDIKAFFPFQRTSASLGAPLAGGMSDFHGLICGPDFSCEPRQLIRKCRLAAWDFNHLLASQKCFSDIHSSEQQSPQMDVSNGYEAYVEARRAAGSEQIKKTNNLIRRIEREVGPLRFVAHSPDAESLQRTLDWKSQQYLSCGEKDLFIPRGWQRALIETLHRTQTSGCRGMLSLLYAGDQLIAGHFGMRSSTVWHYWFPSYDKAFSKYSPGLILLLRLAECAPSLGICTIDLGKGMCLYKERLMSGAVDVATGSVELPSILSLRRAARRALRAAVVKTPFAAFARKLDLWTRAQWDRMNSDRSQDLSQPTIDGDDATPSS